MKKSISNLLGRKFYCLIENLKKHYQLVKSASYISKRLNDQAVIIHYEDYKFYDLVLSTEDRTRIPLFVSSVFYEVLQYDLDNSTEYCDTIFAYIACDKKLEETASKLSVHRNTVSYRMKKAKELFDLDLTQVSQQFRFYYSYLISKMCKSNIL